MSPAEARGKSICQELELWNIELVAHDLGQQLLGLARQFGIHRGCGEGQFVRCLRIRPQGNGRGAKEVLCLRPLGWRRGGGKGVLQGFLACDVVLLFVSQTAQTEICLYPKRRFRGIVDHLRVGGRGNVHSVQFGSQLSHGKSGVASQRVVGESFKEFGKRL